MYEIVIAVLVVVILCLIFTTYTFTLTNKRQEKQIADLLDRLMAPDFPTYQIARERELMITEAKKGIDTVIEEYGEPDGLRID